MGRNPVFCGVFRNPCFLEEKRQSLNRVGYSYDRRWISVVNGATDLPRISKSVALKKTSLLGREVRSDDELDAVSEAALLRLAYRQFTGVSANAKTQFQPMPYTLKKEDGSRINLGTQPEEAAALCIVQRILGKENKDHNDQGHNNSKTITDTFDIHTREMGQEVLTDATNKPKLNTLYDQNNYNQFFANITPRGKSRGTRVIK